jgi:hypothetical protein
MFMKKPWPIVYDGIHYNVQVVRMDEQHHISTAPGQGIDYRSAYRGVFRYFNEIHWFHGVRVQFEGGSHSDHRVEVTHSVDHVSFVSKFKQQVFEERQHLALGLFREAMCHDSPYYQFLTLSRLLEIPFGDQRAKGRWIEMALTGLRSSTAKVMRDRRLDLLGNSTLADWLRDSRNRVAHAKDGQPTSDPNNFDHWEEVKWGNKVLVELACLAIVDELGVIPGELHQLILKGG